MHLPSRSLRRSWWFYLRGENSRRGMHKGLVSLSFSLYLKFPICKRETKWLQKPAADQGIKPVSQPSRAARGVKTPSQEGRLLPQPVGRHVHRAFPLLRGRRDSGLAAHFTTDPSQAVLLLTANSLQHAWCCAKEMAVERKLTSHSELIWFSSFTISLSCFFVLSVNQNSLKLHMEGK